MKDNIDNIQIPDDISINKKFIENSIIKMGIFDGIPVDDYLDMSYTENDEIFVHLESVGDKESASNEIIENEKINDTISNINKKYQTPTKIFALKSLIV